MSKKLLFISNIGGNRVGNFSLSSMNAAKELGFEFHIAANWRNSTNEQMKEDEQTYGITLYHINFKRNPLNIANFKAYTELLSVIKKEKYDVIHCNTPIGGMLGRICAKQTGVNKVIYMAHGFHFYRGAPLINNIIFKWVEKWLAKYTDAIITINHEDYQVAKQFKLRNDGNVYHVHGVGIDTKTYQIIDIDKSNKRKSLNLNEDDIVLISMGDLVNRKNYESSIRAIAKINNSKVHLLICGKGPKKEKLQQLSKDLGVESQIHFLGYRNDIKELLSIADIFLFTTYQEGLPRSMMEAMAVGLPCIASKIRGNVDLIEDGKGGFLCNPNDVEGFADAIQILVGNKDLRKKMGASNLATIKKFDIKNVIKEMLDIYMKEIEY